MPLNRQVENWKPAHPAYRHLLTSLQREVGTVYVAGGAVRDFLLGNDANMADLDIVIEQSAINVARKLADQLGWAFYAMDTIRDIARLVFTANEGQPLVCDISRLRGMSIEDDLSARDFTINSMAIAYQRGMPARLLDLHNGQNDLSNRVLRRTSLPGLSEDPVRLLRAPRLMVQFDLTVESATRAQIQRLADTIQLSSPERERDELWRMFALPHPHQTIEALDSFGLLIHILPEVASMKGVKQSSPHFQDVFAHTLSTVKWAAQLRDWLYGKQLAVLNSDCTGLFEALSPYEFDLRRLFSQSLAVGHCRADWLVWHALLHDTGKPTAMTVETNYVETNSIDDESRQEPRIRFIGHEIASAQLAKTRLEHLRLSRHEIALCETVLSNHMRLHQLHKSFLSSNISRRATYRFFRDIGGQQFSNLLGVDVILLSLADYLATYRNLTDDWPVYLSHATQLLDDAFAEADQSTTQIQPLINGHQLMQRLNIGAGVQVGDLLEQIAEAQAAGEITTEDEAYVYAEKLVRELRV